MTPCQRVGILYSPWHWPAYTAQQIILAKGGTPLNMEMILSSRLELGMLCSSQFILACSSASLQLSGEVAQIRFSMTYGGRLLAVTQMRETIRRSRCTVT